MPLFNPLTVITQPRDIPQFLTQCYEEHRSNKYDRLIIQYTPITKAYHAARRIFLENKQYTHYIYATDDIIYSDETFDRLLADYQKHFADDDKATLCTDMNTDQESLNHLRAFMIDKYPVPLLEYGRQFTEYDYHFATRKDPEVQDAIANNDGIIKCCWSAMPLAIIPRYVVENTTFMSDIEYNNAHRPPGADVIDPKWGCCIDVVFAHECRQKGFPIYTDMNVEVVHLKQSNKKNLWHKEYFQVGKKPPKLFFLNAHTNQENLVILDDGL